MTEICSLCILGLHIYIFVLQGDLTDNLLIVKSQVYDSIKCRK